MNNNEYETIIYEPTKKIESVSNLEHIQNMSLEEYNEHIRKKLDDEIRYAFLNSEFYKNFYYDNGIAYDNFDRNIEKLPFVTKEHLRDLYPFGLLTGEISNIARYGESTGTTGNPTSAYFARDDWFENNIFVADRVRKIFSKNDIAIIAAPYELSIPAQDYERIFEIIGTMVIPCGVLNEVCSWEKIIELIIKMKPTALICSGTRLFLLGEVAQKMGYNPKEFAIKKILNVGDTIHDSKEEKIKKMWGAKVYNAYGMTETCALGISCENNQIHLFTERYFYEVVDPETLQNVQEGEKGELVITSLGNRSMPLIRYRTGDLVSVSNDTCSCGCRRPYLKHYGRVDSFVEIGKSKLSFFEIEEKIMSCQAQNILFQVVYEKDYLELVLDLKDGHSKSELYNEVKERFGKENIQYIHVNIFGLEQREHYFNYLKNSIKPFSKIFKKKGEQQ